MESGYYSEMENPGSLGAYEDGQVPRSRPGKSKPSSMGRRKREFISDEKKDASYWEKRRKNNEAAKRSREKRRLSDMVLEKRVLALNQENAGLRSELLALKLRFGLISAAAYSEKSRRLAGGSVSVYYSGYSGSPAAALLLQHSDSSEAELSSRGSGFTPISKYSPRGSLSDVSDGGSSSPGGSPEPALRPKHHDQRPAEDRDRDRDRDPLQDVQEAALLRCCERPKFVGYKEPAVCSLAPRDIIQCRDGRAHSARLQDLPLSPRPPPEPRGGAEYTVYAKPLASNGPHQAPSSSDASQQSGTQAHRRKGHPLPEDSVMEPSPNSAFQHSVIESFGVLDRATAQRSASRDELERAGSPSSHGEFPVAHGSPIAKQEAPECCFAPCSVIEAPRLSDQGMLAHSHSAVEKVADCALSEGSDCDCPDKVGFDTGTHSGPHPEVRTTALPHKLRLKVRAIQANEQQVNGLDYSQQVSDPGPSWQKPNGFYQNSTLSGCIMKSYASANGKADLWSKAGVLDFKALQSQPGALNSFDQQVSSGHHGYQSPSTSPGLHAVSATLFKAFERNTVRSAERLNSIVGPAEGPQRGRRDMDCGQ
uniref:uncharacterized protein n=1 Tax=Pristiophorus japonicus TaxID=55135 RepID=UPI00398E4CE3